MGNYLKVMASGFLISGIGALPLGALNITAFDIAASQGTVNALLFALAVIVVELFYVWLLLLGHQKIKLDQRFILYLLPLAALLLLYLAVSSFVSAVKPSELPANLAFDGIPKIGSPILLGLLLSALNPLQIPFWMGWNNILFSRNILKPNGGYYGFYLAGIGLGTLLGLSVFILAGNYIVSHFDGYSKITGILLGILYLVFSFYLLFLFFKKRLNLKIQ